MQKVTISSPEGTTTYYQDVDGRWYTYDPDRSGIFEVSFPENTECKHMETYQYQGLFTVKTYCKVCDKEIV